MPERSGGEEDVWMPLWPMGTEAAGALKREKAN